MVRIERDRIVIDSGTWAAGKDPYDFRWVYEAKIGRGEMQDGYGNLLEACPIPKQDMITKFGGSDGFVMLFDSSLSGTKGTWTTVSGKEIFTSVYTEERFLKHMMHANLQRKPLGEGEVLTMNSMEAHILDPNWQTVYVLKKNVVCQVDTTTGKRYYFDLTGTPVRPVRSINPHVVITDIKQLRDIQYGNSN